MPTDPAHRCITHPRRARRAIADAVELQPRRRRPLVLASAIVLPLAFCVAALPTGAGAGTPGPASPRSLAARLGAALAATRGVPDAKTNTLNPYGPAGMNVDAAQSYLARGAHGTTPHVLVAYVEGGVNWSGPNASTLATAMYVNWHDTPVPCVGKTVATATMVLDGHRTACRTAYSTHESDYDTNHDGVVTVTDWAHDPRVKDANADGFLDPEDLIAAFSGRSFVPPRPVPAAYRDAIAGWDFYDNQNDPATGDASYDHSDDQMSVVHAICPTCLILPVKAGDEAIDSTEDLAKAWLFAAQSGARVIVSVSADLGYSTFAEQVLRYLDSIGVIVVESSNDFDSADHQGGMFWGNVLPGNGLVPNTAGVPAGPTLKKMSGPFWTRSDLTSFGVHNMFSVATFGGSTSESTPTLGAVLALVLAEGDEASAAGVRAIPSPLKGPQAVQVLREASAQLRAPAGSHLPWPAPGGEWNEQYGYGMPNVLKALEDVTRGDVVPAPEIDSPRWYSILDPTRGPRSVPVTGTVTAYPGQTYKWQLQYGLGGDPSTAAWHTIASGRRTGSFSGVFGTLALSKIPKSFWSAAFHLSATKDLSTFDQFDVTFRLRTFMSAPAGSRLLTGEARRAIDVFHDPTALPGFPMSITGGTSGESQPALADLQGNGVLDIVFGTADGTIEAIDPRTGKELPGWPAHTDAVRDVNLPAGVSAGDEPIIADVAVGDLLHTGRLSVVATSMDGRVYVFNANGRIEAGWPKVMDDGVAPPPIPRPALPHVRRPVQGDLAPPVLVSLRRGLDLDIVQAGWDGAIHAWYPSGASLPGWPVRVKLPASVKTPKGYTLEADQKLDTPPVVARFKKSGPPDLVIRSQYTDIGSTLGGLEILPYSYEFAFGPNGKLLPGWPVRLQGTIEDYGSAQEFITEGTDSPAAAPVLGADASRPGDSIDEVAVGPVWTPETLLDGAGKILGTYGSLGSVLGAFAGVLGNPHEAIFGPLPPTTPTPFTGSGAFGVFGGHLAFSNPAIGTEHLAAALAYPGSGNPINQLAAAWPATAGSHSGGTTPELSGFPSTEQGQDFLGEPMFAPVSGSGSVGAARRASENDLVMGGDSGAVDARLPSGAEVPGFPKFTGGWSLYAPSAGDLLANGHDDLVTVTREGWLFAWSTAGAAPAAGSWWRAYHDEWNTGRLETDSRPPGVVRDGRLTGTSVTFEAPGANWYDGKASDYEVIALAAGRVGAPIEEVPAASAAGSVVSVKVPSGTTAVVIRAVNSDGLLSNAERITSSGEELADWP